MSMEADELLTDDIRRAFLKERTSYLGIIIFFVFAVLCLVLAYHLSAAWVDYSYLTQHGKVAFGRIVSKEVSISERRGGVRGRSGIPRGGTLVPIAFRVTYIFTVDGKEFKGVGVIPADAYEAEKGVNENILVLFNEGNPSESCVATSDADYERIRAVMEEGGDLRELGVRALYWGGTKWIVIALYIASVLLFVLAGFIIWVSVRARRLLHNAEIVEGEILSVKEDWSVPRRGSGERKLIGHTINVSYTTKGGRNIEAVFSTSKKRLPEGIREGGRVRIVYDGAKVKNFFIYEMYLGR